MSDGHHSPEPSTQRPHKRRRGIACIECRDRKIRCDGARPICDSCSRRNLPPDRCVYADPEPPARAANNSNQYVKELERRVHDLEASIRDKTTSTRKYDNTFRPLGNGSHAQRSSLGHRHLQPLNPTVPRNGAIDDVDDDDDKASNEDPQELPLGESSMAGYIKQAHETLERGGSSNPASSSHGDGTKRNSADSPFLRRQRFGLLAWQSRPRSQQTLSSYVAGMMLPSKELCDKLLQSFWIYEYELMPLFHRPSFMSRYQQMWEADTEASSNAQGSIYEKASFYCLLCGVLALSYRNNPSLGLDIQESEASGMELMERAKQLLYAGLLESSSLEVVQAIIYIAMYQRRVGNHHEAWIFIGLASRVAQALGIHYSIDDGSQAERETRKRIWYGCVILDSMHTTVFGQAPISAGATLPPPSMIDDIYMETDPNKPDREQPSDAIPEIAFFLYSTKLSLITVKILRSIYNTGHASLKDIPATDFRMAMLSHDAELQAWKNELPHYLRIENKDKFSEDRRHRTILYMRVRYLDCRFLLFRAAVLRLAGRAVVELSVLQEGVIRANLESCISSIRELMDLFSQYKQTTFIQGPKHNVVCLLTAATVLALMVRSEFLSQFSPADGTYAQLLSDCMRILRSYDRAHFPMRRKGAADAVERLMQVSTPADTHERVAQFAAQQSAVSGTAAAAADSQSQPQAQGPAQQQQQEQQRYLQDGSSVAPPLTADESAATLDAANIGPSFAGGDNTTDTTLALPNQPLSIEEMDLFSTTEFLGDLTGDLHNPATWVPSELDPFGMGVPGDFDMQNFMDVSGSGAADGDGIAGAGAGAGLYGSGSQYGMPWWQPAAY